MKNDWLKTENDGSQDLWDDVLRSAHLLGREPSLVLHGNGSVSFKARREDVSGAKVPALFVSGRHEHLAAVEERGFSILSLDRVQALAEVDGLSDLQLGAELSVARVDA